MSATSTTAMTTPMMNASQPLEMAAAMIIETMPTPMVRSQPIASRPGCNNLPSAPTTAPTMMNQIQCMTACVSTAGSTKLALLATKRCAAVGQAAMLHEAAVQIEQQDRAEQGEDEAGGAVPEEAGDEAAEERAAEAEQDRREDAHRVGARQREPREPADDQAFEREDDDQRQHRFVLCPETFEQTHTRRGVLVVGEDAAVVQLLEQGQEVRRVLRRVLERTGGRSRRRRRRGRARQLRRRERGRDPVGVDARGPQPLAVLLDPDAAFREAVRLPSEDRPLLHEAPVEADENDGGEKAADADPRRIAARDPVGDRRADERPDEAERNRQPDRHRVGARECKAGERARDERGHDHRDDSPCHTRRVPRMHDREVRATTPAAPFLHAIRLAARAVEDYTDDLPALRGVERIELDPRVTFLVGENGSGKSTLIEALAVASKLNAEGGGKLLRFATRASHSGLHRRLTLERSELPPLNTFFLRAESVFNLATAIEQSGPIGERENVYDRPLHEQSHGESFLDIAVNRLGPRGLYYLDEPEAALSVNGQLALLR